MEPNTEIVNYTAHFELTNSAKVAFSRRDLALCFYPLKVVEKADRIFESLVVNGTRTHEDNPDLVKKLWEIIPKKYIYDGTVKKITKRSFNWGKIANRLCRQYDLKSVRVKPERQRSAMAPVEEIELTSKTTDFDKHAAAITSIRELLHKNNPHLTFEVNCKSNLTGACPI